VLPATSVQLSEVTLSAEPSPLVVLDWMLSAVARPVVPLLDLVQNGRFDAKNKRHRAKLLNDDSLLEFVAYNEDVSVRLRDG
jgi:hypothetical protein